MAAYVRLNEAGLDPVSEPGPWEFLARQSQGAGFGELAHLLRMALWQAGHRTPELALNEAQYALSQSEFETARALLTEVFGETPEDATVRYALAQSLAPSDPEAALATMGDTPAAGPDAQLLRIELLRELDRLKEATDETRAAVARFPDDPRFAVRAARIMESRNDWKAALGWWKTVTETAAGSARSQALWNLARLHLRLENEAEAVAAAARHLAAAPPLSEALATAQLMEQERLGLNLLADAAETARYGQHGSGAVAAVEWGRVARFLLGQGRIGLLAWLWRQNLPLGDLARAVLGGAAFSPDDLGQIGAGIVAADRLRSPDYLLPDALAELRDHAPPAVAGAPVLLVNSTLAAGGAERQLVMLVRALLASGLAKARLHVALFSVAGDRGHAHFLPELKQLGVTVHVLDRRAARAEAPLPRTGRDFVAVLPTQLRSDVVALWPLVRALRPAVLHGWQDRSSLAAGVVGVLEHTPRVVMSARNMEPGKRAGLAARPSAALYRTLIDLPGVTLTANSEAGARDYEAWLGLEGGRCPVIRNAIEIERFPAPAKPPRRGRPKPRPVRILGVFRLAANKRPMLWLETLAELRRIAPFAIAPQLVGSGPFLNEVIAARRHLGLDDLEIRQFLTRPEEIYGEADALLLMSRVEGTPNVVIEAQACGLAVAASDVGGVAGAMLHEGPAAGLLLDPDLAPAAAAGALAEWLPRALSAAPDTRRRFVQDRFDLAVLGATACALYGEPGGRP